MIFMWGIVVMATAAATCAHRLHQKHNIWWRKEGNYSKHESMRGYLEPSRKLEDVLQWMEKAHSVALQFNQDLDLSSSIPFVIVAGDQGVGKSTTINRLVNARILPTRNRSEADKDRAQTTIATLYHVRRDPSADGRKASVYVSHNEIAGTLDQCQPQEVEIGELAQTVYDMQRACFIDRFSPYDTITINYFSPKARAFSIVELPGMRADEDEQKTRELTESWLKRHPNSIVVAVLRAELQSQQAILKILEKNLSSSSYHDRTILVITKPTEDKKGLRMLYSNQTQRLSGGRAVILRSADTSRKGEEGWDFEQQKDQERKYFENSAVHAGLPEIWGIARLSSMFRGMYLRRASALLPKLADLISSRLRSDDDLLQTFSKASKEDLFDDVVTTWAAQFRRNVKQHNTSSELQEHYKYFLESNVTFNQTSIPESGLPLFEMLPLEEEHECWQEWVEHAYRLLDRVRSTMLEAVKQAGEQAVSLVSGSAPGHGLQQEKFKDAVKPLVACIEANDIVKRLVHSHCFVTPEDKATRKDEFQPRHLNLESSEDRDAFMESLQQTLPSSIVRIVIQLCVWEPVRDLNQKTIKHVSGGKLYDLVLSQLNMRKHRKEVTERRDACKDLMDAYPNLLAELDKFH